MTIKHQRNPRVSELIGWTQASMEYGVPVHRIRYAVKVGQLEAVDVPGKRTLIIRNEFEHWLSNKPTRTRTHAGSSK